MNAKIPENCSIHKVEYESYCIHCKKLLCLQCKTSHQKDHTQFIHLADFSGQIIIRMRHQLDEFKATINKENDEVLTLINEFAEDKRYLYNMMKSIEKKIVQMLQFMTINFTKKLQKTDTYLQSLKEKVEAIKDKYDQTEELYTKASSYHMQKKFWESYQMQEELKGSLLDGIDFRDEVIKDSIARLQQLKTKQEVLTIFPRDFYRRKEEVKGLINVTDYEHFKDLNKEMNRELNNINKALNDKIMNLKQREFLLTIKNNTAPLIKRQDKRYLWFWIVNNKIGKKVELELVYKAKRDGFGADTFHSKCDKVRPTLTLISAEDQIFGGYTTQQWKDGNAGGFREDPTAFTFSLTKKVKCPIQPAKRKEAIRQVPTVGAYFGSTEFVIGDKANLNNDSRATGGVTYSLPQGSDPRTFYTGNFNFQVNDVEVYKVII